MAENFQFGLDIDVNSAISEIDKVNKKIDRMTNKKKDNNDIVSQNDFNNTSRDIDDVIQKLDDYRSAVSKANGTSNKSMSEAMKIGEAITNLKALEKQVDSVTRKYRNFSEGSQIKASNQYSSYNHTTGQERSTYSGIGKHQGVAQLRSEYADKGRALTSQSRSREQYTKQINDAGYISSKDFNMAKNLRGNMQQNRDAGIEAHRGKIAEKEGHLKKNDEDARKLMAKKEAGGTLNKEERANLNNIVERNKVIMEELKIMEQYQTKLEASVTSLDEFNQTLQGVKNVKPERGTAMGMAYERAPSIAMGITAVGLGTVYNQVSQGTSLKEGMLDDNLAVGTQTGNYDYFDIRKQGGDAGHDKRVNMSETEMLQAQNSYMNRAGIQDKAGEAVGSDMMKASLNTGTFARGMGVTVAQSSETTANLAQNMNGADASSVKDIQNAFAGALKTSGMVGQAEQQLSALNSVVSGIGEQRGLSKADLGRIVSMQGMLAATGDKSMQGEAGANLMSNIDQSLVGGQKDPIMKTFMMQADPDRYGGVNGFHKAETDLSEGITGAGFGSVIKGVTTMAGQTYGTDPATRSKDEEEGYQDMVRSMLTGVLGNVTIDQSKELVRMQESGELTAGDKMTAKQLEKFESLGAGEIDKNAEGYSESGSAKDKGYKDGKDSTATATSDLMSPIKGLTGDILQASGAFGTLLIATAVLTSAFASMGGSMLLGSGMRGAIGKGTANKGGGNNVPPVTSTGGNKPSGGGGGGVGGFFRSTVDTVKDKVKGAPPGTSALGRSVTSGTAGAATGGLMKGALGKVPVLGAGLTAMFGLQELNQINKSDKEENITGKEHNKKVGGVVGKTGGTVGGMMGGAAVGAAVGSIVPGPGTAIGGVLGSVVGAIGGSKIGESIGGFFGNMFGEDKEKTAKNKEDSATTSQKKAVEDKRAQNIKDDKAFADSYKDAMSGSKSAGATTSGGNRVADDSDSESVASNTSSSATSTDKAKTTPPSNVKPVSNTAGGNSVAMGGTLTVKHTGEIKGGTEAGTVQAINSVNELILKNGKAVLPNGNETRMA